MNSEVAPFPFRAVAKVDPRPPEASWLIEPLWTAESVGLIAADPKVGKTWLAVELALAVATGRPALGRFAARCTGPVLFFGAEDQPSDLRSRFDSVALVRGIDLKHAPLMLLDVPALSLDRADQLERLRVTIAKVAPRLLVLDPFVRIADLDENSSSEVSSVLGSLRALQREFELSIIVVHHMRKAASRRLGARLRGSSDFAAWHDSALYLTEEKEHTLLTVEHRRAHAPGPYHVRLRKDPPAHLEFLADTCIEEPAPDTLGDRILEILSSAERPLSAKALRERLQRRKIAVADALKKLQEAGRIHRNGQGWKLAPRPEPGTQRTLFPGSQP
ncbi:MAG: AAA family ATPase [bacterium]|nr:AAA family ATPase [bacterium]